MTEDDQPKAGQGPLLVLLAAILWGTTGTAQALAPLGAEPMVVGALRLAVGGAGLLAVALLRGRLGDIRAWPVGRTLLAGAFTAAYQLCFFAAVLKTGVAVGTIVAIGSAPMAAGVLGFFFLGERPGRRWMLATCLAVGGCVLLVVTGEESVSVDPLGILLAIGAGVSYSAYTLGIKGLLPGRSSDAVVAVVFCLGALLLAPFLVTGDLRWAADPRGLAVVLHLGLLATALSYVLFARGLVIVPVATAVTLSLAEPLTAGMLGILLLGEQLTFLGSVGIGLLFSGLVLLARKTPAARPEKSGIQPVP